MWPGSSPESAPHLDRGRRFSFGERDRVKLIRFRRSGQAEWGILDGSMARAVAGSVYEGISPGAVVGPLGALDLLPPCEPTKVIGLAYNYKDLVGPRERYDEPLIFFKPPTAVIGPTAPIVLLPELTDVWVEVEVAVVMRRGGRHIAADRAADHILGYTIANDVTARNIAGRDHHLGRSKGLDSFCPVGGVLQVGVDTRDLELSTTINGRRTQHSTTRNRILDDFGVVALVSRYFTLAPGDLILTGTPAGAMDSLIRPGDEVVLDVAGLGRLANPVVEAEDTV